MRQAYHELIETFLARRPGWQEVSASYLRLILALMHAEVLRMKRPKGQATNIAIDRRLRLATEFMERNLAKPLAISDIAEQASLSEDYFRRLFSRQLGMKPVKYLKQLRVKEARRLISEDPRLSVGDVGRMAGFQDERYFARVFKGYYGIPPSQYRATLSAPLSVR
jgi:transcriptional regulator GlxA family with amidase domain